MAPPRTSCAPFLVIGLAPVLLAGARCRHEIAVRPLDASVQFAVPDSAFVIIKPRLHADDDWLRRLTGRGDPVRLALTTYGALNDTTMQIHDTTPFGQAPRVTVATSALNESPVSLYLRSSRQPRPSDRGSSGRGRVEWEGVLGGGPTASEYVVRLLAGPRDALTRAMEDTVRRRCPADSATGCLTGDERARGLAVIELRLIPRTYQPLGLPILDHQECEVLAGDSLRFASDSLTAASRLFSIPQRQAANGRTLLGLVRRVVAHSGPTMANAADRALAYARTSGEVPLLLAQYQDAAKRLRECLHVPGEPVDLLAASDRLVQLDRKPERTSTPPDSVDMLIAPVLSVLDAIGDDTSSTFHQLGSTEVASREARIVNAAFRPLWAAIEPFPDKSVAFETALTAGNTLRERLRSRRWACRPCRDSTQALLARFDSLRVRSVRFAAAELVLPPGLDTVISVSLEPAFTTRRPSMASSDTAVAVFRNGRVVSRSAGRARLTASLDDQADTVEVRVEPVARVDVHVNDAVRPSDTVRLEAGERADLVVVPRAADTTRLPFPVRLRPASSGNMIYKLVDARMVLGRTPGTDSLAAETGGRTFIIPVVVAPAQLSGR